MQGSFLKEKGVFRITQTILVVSFGFLLAGCAALPKLQALVDSMANANDYDAAIKTLKEDANLYGKNNQLLYLLDKAYLEHLNRDYEKSIETFDKAKLKFDELYTKSLSKIAVTWLANDYSAPYAGEDFEQVFINIFQALNYFMLGNLEDALVEARDVDSKLNAINSQYDDTKKNVYKEDAFARLLTGIIYEAAGKKEDLNNAFIAYIKAEIIYECDYKDNYGGSTPAVLKENLLTVSRFMGLSDFSKYREKYPEIKFISLEEKKQKAEVYLIQYNGLCPVKVEEALAVPMPDGYVVKVAFPAYRRREYGIASSRFLAKNARGEVDICETSVGQPVGEIAIGDLARKKLRFIAKTTAKAAARYAIEKKQEESIVKKFGNVPAGWFRFVSSLYNTMVEQADLRSWRILPDEIRICRILLLPGEYEFRAENFSTHGSNLGEYTLGKYAVAAGQKKVFVLHTAR
ncbi:MAG: hypothetical protein KKF93_01220 [Candidatus Omnitrophica bacterium]|nr:hypothetical protein [Candidatus Omnitrophota bacterium]